MPRSDALPDGASTPPPGSTAAAGQRPLPALELAGGVLRPHADRVAEEVPVALVYNGISHAVMLATPADLEDFALGFSLTEGILRTPAELYDCEIEPGCDGIELRMEVASERFALLKERRRSLAGRTGCGLSGIDSLQALAADPSPVHAALAGDTAPTADAIARALTALPDAQPLFRLTGGVHAAAWADREGRLLLVREDVGRHNALDKLLGAAARAGLDAATSFIVCTSRASYEMAHKAAIRGLGLLVAVSAPTGRAIDLAERCGLTLVGFARGGRQILYSHASRLAPPA